MGVRKRIGVMVPSTNTTCEADFQMVGAARRDRARAAALADQRRARPRGDGPHERGRSRAGRALSRHREGRRDRLRLHHRQLLPRARLGQGDGRDHPADGRRAGGGHQPWCVPRRCAPRARAASRWPRRTPEWDRRQSCAATSRPWASRSSDVEAEPTAACGPGNQGINGPEPGGRRRLRVARVPACGGRAPVLVHRVALGGGRRRDRGRQAGSPSSHGTSPAWKPTSLRALGVTERMTGNGRLLASLTRSEAAA